MRGLELRTWYPLRATCKLLPKVGGLYVLRCTVNGKLYVGKSMDLQRRAYKHCRPEHFNSLVARAVLAHGPEAFEIQVWCLGEDEPALLAAEVLLIEELNSMAPAGYNLTAGGEGSSGYRHSPEVLARMAAKLRGKRRDPDAVKRTAEANRGSRRTAQQRENISASLAGQKRTDATRKKMSESHRGKPLSEVNKMRLSHSHKSSEKVMSNILAQGVARQRSVLLWLPDSMTPMSFESIKAAAEFSGCGGSEVSAWCAGKHKNKKGWVFALL